MGCIRGITENSPGGPAMKILLTGAAGQLGQALRQQVPAEVELIATSPNGDVVAPILAQAVAAGEVFGLKGWIRGVECLGPCRSCALTAL